MESYEAAAGEKTPWIILDKKSGLFRITGNSYPDNVLITYEPVIAWFDSYADKPNEDTVVRFKFAYINSSTKKVIVGLMKIFDRIHRSGKGIRVIWEYETEEEDLREIGNELSQQHDVPFILREVKD